MKHKHTSQQEFDNGATFTVSNRTDGYEPDYWVSINDGHSKAVLVGARRKELLNIKKQINLILGKEARDE